MDFLIALSTTQFCQTEHVGRRCLHVASDVIGEYCLVSRGSDTSRMSTNMLMTRLARITESTRLQRTEREQVRLPISTDRPPGRQTRIEQTGGRL
jgi:hypothetical protein